MKITDVTKLTMAEMAGRIMQLEPALDAAAAAVARRNARIKELETGVAVYADKHVDGGTRAGIALLCQLRDDTMDVSRASGREGEK